MYVCFSPCQLNRRQSPQNEITLAPLRGVGPLLSHSVFTGPGSRLGLRAAVTALLPCVRRLSRRSDRPRARKPRTIKARPGWFFASSGSSFCSALGRRHRGGWRVLKSGPDSLWCVCVCLDPPLFLCICVSRLLPRTSIWFDLREMFTLPSKSPFL